MKRVAVAVASLAMLTTSGEAFAQTTASLEPQATIYLLGRLSGGTTLDRYLQSLRGEFARADADGNGTVDATDIDFHNAMNSASLRAMTALRIMNADLDGDGVVTENELRQRMSYERRLNAVMSNVGPRPGVPSAAERLEKEIKNFLTADADKDGRITWNEAIEYVKKQPNYARTVASGTGSPGRQLLALAPQGKSAIALPELEAAATAFFRSVDADGNGTISLDELDTVRKSANAANAEFIRRRAEQAAAVSCEMPKASSAAKVVLLSAYETDALSTVAIGSQDNVTGVGTVAIEQGEGPLYLVIASHRPTIWRFYGAVERVERVVLTTTSVLARKNIPYQPQLAGVVGLPADRISFPPRAGCLNYFTEAPSINSAKATGIVKESTGKAPDVVAARYKMTGFSVPSGKIEGAERGRAQLLVIQKSGGSLVIEGDARNIQVQTPSGNLETELNRYSPGGVVTVDAKNVVASAPVEPYEVLPQQAGLIQLVKSGALTQNKSGEFLINRKIRIPAGLAGAHSVKFLLRRGVPEPDGDPGHSSIISEETGKPLQRRQ